jgi:hypothetical protein
VARRTLHLAALEFTVIASLKAATTLPSWRAAQLILALLLPVLPTQTACAGNAATRADSDTVAADDPVLSPMAYGPIRFGSRLEDIEGLLHEKAEPRHREPACDFVTFRRFRKVRFMVEQGVITRADQIRPGPTSIGLQLGMPLARARKLAPGIDETTHIYDPEGFYLTHRLSDPAAALVFEADKNKITAARGGLAPAVEYENGCR